MVPVVDPSMQNQAVAAAAMTDRKMRAMTEALPHAIFVAEFGGKLRYVNQRWKDLTGLDENSLNPATWAQVIHPEDRPLVHSSWTSCVKNRHLFDVYARLKRVDSTHYRWQRLLAQCYTEYGPEDFVWVGSWTDVHDRITQDLATAAAQAQFVATLSHDLRSPLTAIRASVENMQRKLAADAPFASKFGRIIQTIDRADAMLGDLLDVSRITGDVAPVVDLEPLGLYDVLELSLANYQASHPHRLMVHVPKGITGCWHGPMLTRAVDNLLGNAFKHGDATGQVTVTATQNEHQCMIRVHNAGEPIDEEAQRHIFAPYARGVACTTRGWGLGLSMVLGVAKAHGGQVQVQSDAETGTTFTLVLPKQPHVTSGLPTVTYAQAITLPQDRQDAGPGAGRLL